MATATTTGGGAEEEEEGEGKERRGEEEKAEGREGNNIGIPGDGSAAATITTINNGNGDGNGNKGGLTVESICERRGAQGHLDATVSAFKGTLVDVGLDADGNVIITVRRRYGAEDIVRGMQRLRGREYIFKFLTEQGGAGL